MADAADATCHAGREHEAGNKEEAVAWHAGKQHEAEEGDTAAAAQAGDSPAATKAKKRKKKKKKATPAVMLHLCSLAVSDAGRAICRLPAAAWTLLDLPWYGWPVTVAIGPETMVLATAWPLAGHVGLGEADWHMTLDVSLVYGTDSLVGLPKALPLDHVKLAPRTMQPCRELRVYFQAEAGSALDATAAVRDGWTGRGVVTGARGRWEGVEALVLATLPSAQTSLEAVLVTQETKIYVTAIKPLPPVTIGEELLPGLETEFLSLVELIRLPLQHAGAFSRLGMDAPKGVLLYGPPGTGKTLLARSAAARCDAHFVAIGASELAGTFMGETESNLRAAFAQAKQTATTRACVLFIDEIDTLCPRREQGASYENRVVAQLLTLMDGLQARGQLVVIGATNRPNAVDPALRRPGRFDRELSITVPNVRQRAAILHFHLQAMPMAPDCCLDRLAERTVGYVGADLAALCRGAGLRALKRHVLAPTTLPVVAMSDLLAELGTLVPSTRREGALMVQPVLWSDIGGLEDVKTQLRQSVEWPQQYPETFARLGVRPPQGVLLYGPPGCAKTTLVKAAATATACTFLAINGAQIYSPYVGDAERHIRDIFKQARLAAPTILFLDEVDALVGKRSLGGGEANGVQERVLSTLLNEMDGIEARSDVLIVAATNRPDMLDRAFLRPGRIDKMVFVPPPDQPGRRAILEVHARRLPLADDVDLCLLAAGTERFTGADLQNLCREAALLALRINLTETTVSMHHFRAALSVMAPSLSDSSFRNDGSF